jgi:hypothetical protein
MLCCYLFCCRGEVLSSSSLSLQLILSLCSWSKDPSSLPYMAEQVLARLQIEGRVDRWKADCGINELARTLHDLVSSSNSSGWEQWEEIVESL